MLHRRISTAALALAAALAGTAHATDGTWDASWAPRNGDQKGIPGLFEDTWSLGGGGTYANDMTATATVVQADGKVLVAGFGWNTSNGTDQNACIVRRYNADGSVDTGFGNGGAVVSNWAMPSGASPKADCYAKAVAVQADGRIVYAGQITNDNGVRPTALVARLNADGGTDTSFGASGFRTNFGYDLNALMIAGNGDILVAGSWVQSGFSDTDFYLGTLSPAGNLASEAAAHFDVAGSDKNDIATAAVLETWAFGTPGNFHVHDEVYLVGIVDDPAYASGQAHHSCGVAAFTRSDGGLFALDTGFNGSGTARADFGVGIGDTDTICRTAARRPGAVVLGPTGVVVGGERYFTPGGAALGSASYYALADFSASGALARHDDFAFFADLNEAGAFNSIDSLAWDNLGKLVAVGYAGIGANGDQAHAPSDGVVRRFDSDFSVDGSFATDHSGTLFASLDTTGVAGILQSQREWSNSVAFDPVHGRVVFVGERSLWLSLLPNLYSWFLGAVHDGNVAPPDRIFANGFD